MTKTWGPKRGLLFAPQVVATLGTTSCCSFDNLLEVGPICEYLIGFSSGKCSRYMKTLVDLLLWALLLHNINNIGQVYIIIS